MNQLPLPENPALDVLITIHKEAAFCGCKFAVPARWNGKFWEYVGSPWCRPHGNVGRETVGWEPSGSPTTIPRQPLAELAETINAAFQTN